MSKYMYLFKNLQMLQLYTLIKELKTTKITMAKQGPLNSFLPRRIPSYGNNQTCLELEEQSRVNLDILSPFRLHFLVFTVEPRLDELANQNQAYCLH